jgi:glutamate formiminotransferase/formiminotetrahydrofolate cyclodeaminase
MNEQLIECVPNFSEGRDMALIKQITDVIKAVDDVRLLDVDPGADMNRVVVTFVGPPAGVKEAAFQAIRKAAELIDMSRHKGTHPRMGATDVCPFVPVSGVTFEECIALSREVAERVGEELGIPIYLYEKSAQLPERQNLAVVRHGEYEALPEKLKKPEWKPDFGPAEFNARAGATAIGVREFLIAYNVNLNTREFKHATDIAFELRAKGRSVRRGHTEQYYLWGEEIPTYEAGNYPCGDCEFVGKTIDDTILHCCDAHGYDLAEVLSLHDVDPAKPEGQSVKKPGKFPHCKAIGWMAGEYDRAQISINLTDYKVTAMHDVLEEARRLAAARGLVVTGSEIVGMVPYAALLETGKYYLRKQGRSAGVPMRDILETAVQSLGLRDATDFVIEERVLGLPKNLDDALVEMTVTEFIDEVSRESPAPGGGSIAALAGALGAALSSMVANLSANIRGSFDVDKPLNEAAEQCQELKEALVRAIDADTAAFNSYMEALRLPQKTDEEQARRSAAIQDGLKEAVAVPLATARWSLQAIEIARTVVRLGNPNSITDVGVGVQMAFAGLKGGVYNVLINLRTIKDKDFVKEMRDECARLEQAGSAALKEVADQVEARLQ